MSRATSSRYLQSVELLKATKEKDDFGNIGAVAYEKIAEVSANVEEIGGSRLVWFKERGYSKPCTIRMWDSHQGEYDAIRYNGHFVQLQSRDIDPDNSLKIVITGDIIDYEM